MYGSLMGTIRPHCSTLTPRISHLQHHILLQNTLIYQRSLLKQYIYYFSRDLFCLI